MKAFHNEAFQNYEISRSNIEHKLTSCPGMLRKMREKLPVNIKKKVYQTHFEFHLLYLNMIWACENVIGPLQYIIHKN